MSQHGVEQAIGRAMLDPKFRKKFLEDPEGAAKAEGLSVSGSEAEKIKAAIEQMRGVSGVEIQNVNLAEGKQVKFKMRGKL